MYFGIMFYFLVKFKNKLRIAHFIIGAEIFAYYCLITFSAPWPMGGHSHGGGPHRIWPPNLCGGSPL